MTDQPAGRPKSTRKRPDTMKTDLPRPLRERIGVIQDAMVEETGRAVTVPETIERIVDFYEREHQG